MTRPPRYEHAPHTVEHVPYWCILLSIHTVEHARIVVLLSMHSTVDTYLLTYYLLYFLVITGRGGPSRPPPRVSVKT